MITIKSKYEDVKIFASTVEEEAIKQITELANSLLGENAHIRIMSDCHAGTGCTIGTTMKITDKICPNLVGVDIGCGMEVVALNEKKIDFKNLDWIINTYIPSGRSIHTKQRSSDTFYIAMLSKLNCAADVDIEKAARSIGTLGGGNHFIEVDKDNEDNLYLIVHSGSRHLGVEVAQYYQKKAYKTLCTPDEDKIKEIVEILKQQNRQSEISQALIEYKKSLDNDIKPSLAYCERQLMLDYIHDMRIVQNFALFNRYAIVSEILTRIDEPISVKNQFSTIHNYIDTENMILRKGAVSAKKGERLIIPINMRDGSLICVGKGNEDWNYSAPHGAGRLLSRKAAREKFSINDYKAQMEGIYSSSVNKATIDECPMAYKDMSEIVENIKDTVEIEKVIKPVYNFKAST